MANLQKVVYLTDSQLQTLFNNGSITVDDQTITYSPNDLYVTPSNPTAEVSIISPSTGTDFVLLPYPVTYNFGEKSILTVTVTATTEYHFMFSSPSDAACVLTMNGITGTTGDTVEAGKKYEVDVWAGIALIKEIEVTAV